MQWQSPPTSHLRPPIGSLVHSDSLTLPFLFFLFIIVLHIYVVFHLFWSLLEGKQHTIKDKLGTLFSQSQGQEVERPFTSQVDRK